MIAVVRDRILAPALSFQMALETRVPCGLKRRARRSSTRKLDKFDIDPKIGLPPPFRRCDACRLRHSGRAGEIDSLQRKCARMPIHSEDWYRAYTAQRPWRCPGQSGSSKLR